MDLKVGDAVKLLNEKSEGFVTAVLENGAFRVETDDGFEYDLPAGEIIKVSEDGEGVEYEIDKKAVMKKIRQDHLTSASNASFHPKRLKSYLDNRLVNAQGIIEIDLHLEELVKDPRHLKDWQKIEVQLEHFRSCVNEAIEMRITDLVFIHGKGQGRLKTEIRNALDAYPGIDYFDASFQRYGYGATQIKIRGLYAGY